MSDLSNVDAASSSDQIAAADAEQKPKKTRKPRTRKAAAADVVASEVPVKKTRAKRGSKVGSEAAPKSVGRKQVRTVAGAAKEAKAASMSAIELDDISSLIQLEEENKNLRKQLYDKLHAENADLRKRLGKS